MYYHWQGPEDAPQIVWLAGLGQDHLAFGLQVATFAKFFRCLLLDNRDVGRSGTVALDYSGADMANDLAGLLDALRVASINVVGLSLGGVVAQEFAIAYPERVQQLVLLSTFPGADLWMQALLATWSGLYASLAPAEFVRAVSPWVYNWRTYQQRPAFIETLAQRRSEVRYPQTAAAYARQIRVSFHHNALERLPLIQAPTLVLVGSEDLLTPPRYAQLMTEKIPDARLAIVPDTGHGGSVEQPSAFNRLMLDFFQAP
jgi:pimeloyl-ACP methyl ester carboxylesterase